MYNRRSICLSDSESESSEGYVNKMTDTVRTRRFSTTSEQRSSLPRTIQRKNSKVLTPEVLDLCAKEIQQESMFKKRYEQAALFVYGTNPGQLHCGVESGAVLLGSSCDQYFISSPLHPPSLGYCPFSFVCCFSGFRREIFSASVLSNGTT